MPNAAENRPSYVTKGDVFRDLGFTPEKALALKFKAKILIAILDEVKRKKYRQSRLVKVLDEHQPVGLAECGGELIHDAAWNMGEIVFGFLAEQRFLAGVKAGV